VVVISVGDGVPVDDNGTVVVGAGVPVVEGVAVGDAAPVVVGVGVPGVVVVVVVVSTHAIIPTVTCM